MESIKLRDHGVIQLKIRYPPGHALEIPVCSFDDESDDIPELVARLWLNQVATDMMLRFISSQTEGQYSIAGFLRHA